MSTTAIRVLSFVAVLMLGITGCSREQPSESLRKAADDTPAEHAIKHTNPRYRCPMHPNVVRDEPGQCPICGMTLVRIEDESAGAEVRISPAVVNNLGVRTAEASRGRLSQRVDTVGYVTFDERRVRQVRPRAEGWVESLSVRAMGEYVKEGQPLFSVYSPMLHAAQQEYRDALKIGNAELIAASKERLRSLGMSPSASGKGGSRVTYVAPISGIVTELEVREGSMITPDMAAVTITQSDAMWVIAEVPESQAAGITEGTKAELRFASMPGRPLEGQVDYVYPELNMEARTIRARISLEEPPPGVRANMLANVSLLGGETAETVNVPRSALIRSGTEDRVVVALGEGRFAPRRVVTGQESGDQVAILEGLAAGEKVVVAGQFLIDSEANLRAGLERLGEESSQ
jgi:Cu(I)/Ag(I) efflux system membrane fusion protein